MLNKQVTNKVMPHPCGRCNALCHNHETMSRNFVIFGEMKTHFIYILATFKHVVVI